MALHNDIRTRLHHLINAQACGGPEDGLSKVTPFMLTGFYLDDSDLQALDPFLDPPDEKLASGGEVGRYLGVPVYPRWFALEEKRRPEGLYRGIVFGYVEMLHVLIAPVPDPE